MEIYKTEDPRVWAYQVDKKTYKISINEDLEYFLSRDNFKPERDHRGAILELKGISFEKILENIIGNNYSDYILNEANIGQFNIAIQELRIS